tara:strand:- start:1953 stop:2339 length:387 start_codon:yes stop_codon:yes gene_type:complete
MVTILVVDDSELARVNILYQLKNIYEEINILFAETIEKAWGILNENSVDIALIDIYMPGKNGADLINDMLAHEKFKNIPIIVVTGTSEDSFVKTSFEKHVHAYLHKPIDKDKLLNSIKDIDVEAACLK